MTRRTILATTFAATILIAGCGDDLGGEPDTPTTIRDQDRDQAPDQDQNRNQDRIRDPTRTTEGSP